MPISRNPVPNPSRRRLTEALKAFDVVKSDHPQWMHFVPSKAGSILHAHPLYSMDLARFLDGKALSATLKKTGWMYFLRDHRMRLVCGEVRCASGRHMNPRLHEGPFARLAFQSIERVKRDPRIQHHRYQLRSLRLDSLHLFCLWLKGAHGEYFIPVSASSPVLKKGKWMPRKEFSAALRSEGQRIRAAQERMSRLLANRQA